MKTMKRMAARPATAGAVRDRIARLGRGMVQVNRAAVDPSSPAMLTARDYFDARGYRLAILVGGPITNDFHAMDANFARRAANYLALNGMSPEKMVVVEVPHSAQNRTFLNGVYTRDWFRKHGIEVKSIDVFSSPAHTRRSRDLYRIAFGDEVEVGIVASNPGDFEPERWWRSSSSGKNIAAEFAGWLLVKCCFDPGEPGSHFEKWGIDKNAGD